MHVFLDTNIILEGRPLPDLPWSQLAGGGSIFVYFVPKVLSEIDSKKRDGRLGEKARAFNRWIAPLATSDAQLFICEEPNVEVRLANPGKIDWEALPDFNLDEPDARIVAEVFNVSGLEASQKILISQDINPLVLARRLGLGIKHVGADWLAPREPSPAEKEISRLKQRVKDFEVTEPTLHIQVESSSTPIEVPRIRRVGEVARAAYLDGLMHRAVPCNNRDALGLGVRDYGYERRLKNFKTRNLPEYVNNVERYLGLALAQVPFTVRVRNSGNLRADRLIVRICGSGVLLHSKFLSLSPSGPTAPVPRPDSLIRAGMFSRPPAPVGPHEIYFDKKPTAGGSLIEAHCQDFRQGADWEFRGFAAIDPTFDGAAMVEVEVTAANKRGITRECFTFPKISVDVSFEEVVDLATLKFKRQSHCAEEIRAIVEKGDFKRVETHWLAAVD